jgi:hypothetical protein
MRVRGRISGKWQNCHIVTVDGEIRFQVTGACGERKFDLTYGQLIEATDCADFSTCTNRELRLISREASIFMN